MSVNAALVPVRKWILQKEYNLSETEKLLSQKLESIDPNKIVQPETHIAVPALQAISYSMDNEDLRNLYANLLSKSMNMDTKDSIHPAFVEIIKQLSPLDAKVLSIICNNKVNPLIDINIFNTVTGAISGRIQSNFTNIDIADPKLVSISIENLKRLNLIEVPSGVSYIKEEVYEDVYKSDYYKVLEEACSKHPGFEIDRHHKSIRVTDMGQSFYEICVVD
ncbi:Uncharacterised protein [[Clostridium] sordellii]|uniref:DUF4393 domain-containing protein n=1 Tax=Paraclostridium sordellii TaxID=1505 RepID=UPI0005E622F1|nr:DUF4393 domain-containing protein [Paeniclostridium sordellii]CEP41663.1 Uncharacterised protein [[Clostridium] sordellii] [Paeniclostridium sordellii]